MLTSLNDLVIGLFSPAVQLDAPESLVRALSACVGGAPRGRAAWDNPTKIPPAAHLEALSMKERMERFHFRSGGWSGRQQGLVWGGPPCSLFR